MITPSNQRQDDGPRGAERRTAPRTDAALLGPISARLLGGQDCKLLDFSRRGVLIESTDRLLIGARATLRIVTVDASLAIQGRVVRSKVISAGPKGLVYYTALALDDDLSVLEAAAHERRDAWGPETTTSAATSSSSSSPSALSSGAARGPEVLMSSDPPIASVPVLAPMPVAMPAPVHDLSTGSERALEPKPDGASNGEASDLVLEFLATVPHDLAELRRRAAVNNW